MSTTELLEDILRRYEWFDGSKVVAFGMAMEPDQLSSSVWVELNAYRIEDINRTAGWTRVKLIARGNAVFSWRHLPRDQNVLPNHPVSVSRSKELIVVDFDPLHPVENIDDVSISNFFVGGNDVSVEEVS